MTNEKRVKKIDKNTLIENASRRLIERGELTTDSAIVREIRSMSVGEIVVFADYPAGSMEAPNDE
jgi:hypothetical protein